ncbi:hypothetical protein TNCV_3916481 [Trichonephila clavipes]|nr:hypothetical protein TNCV_3916481 [Trichonephila clavipes]
MNVCLYVIDELKNYCTGSYENWYIYEFFHGEACYTICDFATFYKFKSITSFLYNYASKRRAIGRSTPQARKRRALRASESDEQLADLHLKHEREEYYEPQNQTSNEH